MNIYQRIVLILGAIALIVVFMLTPRGYYKYNYFFDFEGLSVIHLESFLIKAFIVISCTLLVFFSLKGIVKKKGK